MEPRTEPTGTPRISRRGLLGGAAGLGGAVALGVPGVAACAPTPPAWQRPGRAGAPPVAGLHLQFGADASGEVVVSWHTSASVGNPRVMLGSPNGGFGRTATADTQTYRDGLSGTEVQIHHARLTGLTPDTGYLYAAVHDGAGPELGTIRTAPRGRAPFTFTSFGDQATPTLDKLTGATYGADNYASPGGRRRDGGRRAHPSPPARSG
jgi:hypothetical protein